MGRGAEKLFLKTSFFLLFYIGQLIRNSRPELSACMARWCPVISKWMHMPKHPWFLKIGCLSPETLHQCSVCERAGISHESTNKLCSKTFRKLWNFRCLSVHMPFMLKAVQSGLIVIINFFFKKRYWLKSSIMTKFGIVRATFRFELCQGLQHEQCWETGKSYFSFSSQHLRGSGTRVDLPEGACHCWRPPRRPLGFLFAFCSVCRSLYQSLQYLVRNSVSYNFHAPLL